MSRMPIVKFVSLLLSLLVGATVDSLNIGASVTVSIENLLGSISGKIRIDGKPAAGLEAALLPKHYYMRENAIATVKTDKAGRYRFTEVQTGHYWISVHAPGYLNAVNWDEEGPGRNVSVADGQAVENADLVLILGGVIAGRITDAEGKPVAGEYVELTMLDKLGPPDETLDLYAEEDELFVTDSSGRYRIYGIPAGRYLVSIGVDVAKVTGASRSMPGSSHPTGQVDGDHYFEQTFHPGVRDRARARVIDISAGAEVRDVDIRVGKAFCAYTVSGRVIDAESHKPIRHCYIQMGPYTGRGYASSYSPDGPSDTDHDGNFRIEGLLPGRFFVSAQFEGETDLYCTPVEFEVKDRDITEIQIKANRGLALSGSVTVEGTKKEEVTTKLAQLKLHTTSDRHDIGHDSREAAVNSDGSFTIRGLRPDRVRVDLGYEEASKYFSMIRIEYPDAGGEIRAIPATTFWRPWDAPSLPLGERGLKGVRIVVSYHNGSIRGHATIARGELDPEARLQAGISKQTEKGSSWGTSMEVDANGDFSIEGLDPGEYEISIYDEMRRFFETKRVIVSKDSETSVSFVIDLSTKKKRD